MAATTTLKTNPFASAAKAKAAPNGLALAYTKHIDAPASCVWETLSDPTQYPEFFSAVEAVDIITQGPKHADYGKGYRWCEHRLVPMGRRGEKMRKVKMEKVVTTVSSEEPRSSGVEIYIHGQPRSNVITGQYTIVDESSSSSCRLLCTTAFTTHSVVGRLALFLFRSHYKRKISRQIERDLADLSLEAQRRYHKKKRSKPS